jgi:hypothetical protein
MEYISVSTSALSIFLTGFIVGACAVVFFACLLGEIKR